MLFPGSSEQKDGYCTAEDITTQALNAAAIVNAHWPDVCHVFIYDNTTTHKKCEDNALSACKMLRVSVRN
jgi:hypothetical protein